MKGRINLKQRAAASLSDLCQLIATLRSPGGCQWDRQQTKNSLGRYLRDETYEVIDAIDRESPEALREELGDTLFLILFLSRLAEETGEFDINDVMADVMEKMIRRHPHVFGQTSVKSVDDIKLNWELIKKKEKTDSEQSVLGNVSPSLPPMLAALTITKNASAVGFDWTTAEGVFEKIEEEVRELKEALCSGDRRRLCEELGDAFFSLVNLCRFTGIDPEEALGQTNKKFLRRFAFVEKEIKAIGKEPGAATLEEMDAIWNRAKDCEGKNE